MQARDSLIFCSSSAVFVPLHTGTLLFIFLYVEYTNWAKNIEITTRFLYLQCFSDVSTSALEIIQSYAAAHADQPKMPICWYLECFYFLQPAVIHLCKNRYFWPNVFCCFFRLKTSSKMRMKPPFFWCHVYKQKNIQARNIIGGNQKKSHAKNAVNLRVSQNFTKKNYHPFYPQQKGGFFSPLFHPTLLGFVFFFSQALTLLSSEMMRLNTWRMASRRGNPVELGQTWEKHRRFGKIPLELMQEMDNKMITKIIIQWSNKLASCSPKLLHSLQIFAYAYSRQYASNPFFLTFSHFYIMLELRPGCASNK